MKNVGPVRQKLGFRTIFNMLGHFESCKSKTGRRSLFKEVYEIL